MRGLCVLMFIVICFSCSKETSELSYTNLKEYININSNIDTDVDVIACAASNAVDTDITYIFYYPVPGATEIKYFETSNVQDDKNDFSLYTPVNLKIEPVFNGYLERFVREVDTEVWCIVSYKFGDKLRTSNPIRLKHKTKPTEWTDAVAIDLREKTMPKFSWLDGRIDETAIYFQVVTDASNNLLSGTYTYEKKFQYYVLENVVLNVTRSTPPELIADDHYKFTLMGVSLDNWVNLVIQKEFKIE